MPEEQNYDDEAVPYWVEQARYGMEALGISDELLLTRALILGMPTPYEFKGRHEHSSSRWIVDAPLLEPENLTRRLLGETPAQCAYRWLLNYYPDALKANPP